MYSQSGLYKAPSIQAVSVPMFVASCLLPRELLERKSILQAGTLSGSFLPYLGGKSEQAEFQEEKKCITSSVSLPELFISPL